ncbi:MAG: patatin-like phospholipase family protein [Bacteroidetes bacterium]|nr:patatin-like phospholipase family protein [Bacteroidota bacterium]
MLRNLTLAFLLFLTILSPSVRAQKVALVLSGGGSRGAAHIGVIRALEENRIPISYIVGTSIGAIVGSLYASGYTPDEMEKLMESEEFQRWAAGASNDDYIYYYRKEDPNGGWVSLDFDFKKKLTSQLPTNLISPYELDFSILQILGPASAVCKNNFDSLMVPFRCVVADVDSTQKIILGKGDLSSAVRGSMSIPFVFTPITIDGKLVFDGGMYDNFPADVAVQEFHPDVIIGSRVAERYSSPDRDDVVSQLLSMLMAHQNDSIPYPNSVLIAPKIPKVNIISFAKTHELADSGYVQAIRKIKDIRKLVKDSLDPEILSQRRVAFQKNKPVIVFDSIHVTGLNIAQTRYVIQILKHGRRLVSAEDLRKEYFRFINEGFIKGIHPVARFNPETGYYDLYLDIQKAENFNLQFGGNVSIGATSQGFLELQYKYLWTKALRFMINGYMGRFYNSVKGNARIDFNSKVPWFMETGYTYNHYDYFATTTYFFDDKTPSYVRQREYFGDLRIGMAVTNKGKLSFSTTYAFTNSKYYQENNFSRLDTTDQTSFNFVNPQFCFELNNLNRKQYASAGASFLLSVGYINGMEGFLPGSLSPDKQEIKANHSWFYFKLLYDNYFKSLGPVKFGFYAEARISNEPLMSNYTSTILNAPDFHPIPEMQTLLIPAYRALSYGGLGLKAVLTLYKKLDFRLEGFLFQPYQQITENPADKTAMLGPVLSDRAWIASTSLVYNTFIGPISIGVNYYDKKDEHFTINVNIGYILFNRRALP